MTDLQNKAVLITGASRGIGRAIALRLAKANMRVVVNYRAGKKEAEAVVKEIGDHAIALQANVADRAAVKKMVAEAVAHFGSLDFLVNNAGIIRDALFAKMTDEQWDEVIATNLTGVYNCCKAVLPHLSEGSAIVNLSSVVGQMGNRGQANYAAAKAGLIGFTKTLARELGPKNIRVNAVAPGLIETEMTKSIPFYIKKLIHQITPLGRSGKPEEVAEAVLFLLQNTYITGEILQVNGGLYM